MFRRIARVGMACVALGAACIHQRTVARRDEPADLIMLNVANNHQAEITVYAIRQGVRDRVGMVSAGTTGSFRVRLRMIGAGGELQLRAEAVGGARSVTSEALRLFAGQTVDWALDVDLTGGSVIVR